MGNQKSNEELEHAGVKGMKWGVRKDDPKRGYVMGHKKNTPQQSKDSRRVASLKNRKGKQLSNRELESAIKRMELEKRYSDLNPKGVKKGKQVALGIIATATTVNAILAISKSPAGQYMAKGIQQLIKK